LIGHTRKREKKKKREKSERKKKRRKKRKKKGSAFLYIDTRIKAKLKVCYVFPLFVSH